MICRNESYIIISLSSPTIIKDRIYLDLDTWCNTKGLSCADSMVIVESEAGGLLHCVVPVETHTVVPGVAHTQQEHGLPEEEWGDQDCVYTRVLNLSSNMSRNRSYSAYFCLRPNGGA